MSLHTPSAEVVDNDAVNKAHLDARFVLSFIPYVGSFADTSNTLLFCSLEFENWGLVVFELIEIYVVEYLYITSLEVCPTSEMFEFDPACFLAICYLYEYPRSHIIFWLWLYWACLIKGLAPYTLDNYL